MLTLTCPLNEDETSDEGDQHVPETVAGDDEHEPKHNSTDLLLQQKIKNMKAEWGDVVGAKHYRQHDHQTC